MTKVPRIAFILLVVVGLLIYPACAPKVEPSPQSTGPAAPGAPAVAPKTEAAPAPAKAAWEVNWEKTLELAKKEGTVSVLCGGGVGVRDSIMRGFKAAYGIEAEVLAGKADGLLPKVLAERRAGLYLYDTWVGATSSWLVQAKQNGLAQSMDSHLIIPDLTDPALIKKVWYKGELPWIDANHTLVATTLTARSPIVINTNLVKPDEIKSWRDLLNPKWNGKIIVSDPTVSGAGQKGIATIDAMLGWDFVKELAATKPIVMRDERMHLDWLSHGKVAIVVIPKPDMLVEFLRIGAPIKGVVPVEGTWVSVGATPLGFMTKEAHPNATKVFINWILSKEGAEVFASGVGFQSTREDVRTDYLRPEDIRQEGAKYFNPDTEAFATGARYAEVANKLAKDLFGPLVVK